MDHLHVASQRSRLAIAVLTVVALIAALILVISPARSLAAEPGDQIYWANEAEGGTIRVANLADGSGASILSGAPFGGAPCGIAIDPAAGTDGKIYWADFSQSSIRVANLDGTGVTDLITGEDNPCGVAIDPVDNKIYWANFVDVGTTSGTIRSADLDDGSNKGTLVSGQFGPSGVAIDPDHNKIYWTNQDPGGPNGAVWSADLDDGGDPQAIVASQANPIGVAIDAVTGNIYWANLGSCCSGPGAIRSAGLDGSNPVTLVDQTTAGAAAVAGPAGVAIDPGDNKIYWANFGGGTIWSAKLDGTEPQELVGSAGGAGGAFSNFPVLLRAPVVTADPAISEAGGELSCQGEWASDLLGAFLYRAPGSFAYRWFLGGGEIADETQPTFTPSGPGAYTCEVTASNHAGSTSRTSAAFTVSPELTALGEAHAWVGLKNSDDQGTRFDVQVELLENGTVVASGVSRCVIGVTRNANQAKEVVVPWGSFGGVTLDPGDVLALRVSTRIGTNANNTKCSGHNNAVGLRLYYDSTTRDSRFGATITPNLSAATEYLHSDGGACTSTESAGVMTRTFDEVAPSSTTAKCKDSSSINFSGGNPWKVIGTWSQTQ